MFTKFVHGMRADFPYVSSAHTPTLSARHWYWVLASVLLAVASLLFLPLLFNQQMRATEVGILIFALMPITTLYFMSGDKGRGLLRRMTFKAIVMSIVFGVVIFVLSICSALLMTQVIDTAPNLAVHGLKTMSGEQKLHFFIFSVPQLFGEEVITILPFLAVLHLGARYFQCKKVNAVLFAWIITAIWFALIHLPAYDWNLVQVLWGVGFARLLLTGVYIITKNLWVSTGAHITNDWLMFLIAMLGE